VCEEIDQSECGAGSASARDHRGLDRHSRRKRCCCDIGLCAILRKNPLNALNRLRVGALSPMLGNHGGIYSSHTTSLLTS
jgi:hypothetical protein